MLGSLVAEDPALRQAELLTVLLSQNATLTVRLLHAYAKIYHDLIEDWLVVLNEIERARAEGRDLGILTYRSERVVALALQTARQVDRFAQQAVVEVAGQQRTAALAAQAHAEEITRLAVNAVAPQTRIPFAALPTRAIEQMVGRFSNGMPLSALFGTMGAEAAQQAQDILVQGLALGQSPVESGRKLRDVLSLPASRARTIATHETLGVYRDSTLAAYRQNDDLVQAWRWNAHLDSHTCLSCVALHGSIHPLTERMAEHVQGRCVPSPVLAPLATLGDVQGKVRREQGLDFTGEDYWDGLTDEEKRRRLGPTKFRLMEAGQIELQDLVYADNNPLWGLQYREASISQALWYHSLGTDRFHYSLR